MRSMCYIAPNCDADHALDYAGHNRYRMPTRLKRTSKGKGAAATEPSVASKDDTKRCRKHRRRVASMIRRQQDPNDGSNKNSSSTQAPPSFKSGYRLPTHLWHSKRMHMKQSWGYSLADRRCDRGVRAAYKDTQQHCTLYDASYLTAVELQGQEKSILALLRQFTDPMDTTFCNEMYLSGARQGVAMLYTPGSFPLGAIAPTSFLWRQQLENETENENEGEGESGSENGNTNGRQLWLWLHPAVAQSTVSLLQQTAAQMAMAEHSAVHVACLNHQLCRFEIRGRNVPVVPCHYCGEFTDLSLHA